MIRDRSGPAAKRQRHVGRDRRASLELNLRRRMKVKGEVVWHHHDVTDDLVFVLNGRVTIRRHEVYVTC